MGNAIRRKQEEQEKEVLLHKRRTAEMTDRDHEAMKERPRGGWRACSFIVVVELLERFSHHGIASNLVSYLTNVLRFSTASAAQDINNFQGTNAIVPIVGGFVADAYLGRYATSVVGCIFYVLGLFLLTLVVSLPSLRPSSYVPTRGGVVSLEGATSAWQVGLFFCALYMTSIGLGATTPCFEAFGADQFEEGEGEVRGFKARRRKSSFFNWWFFAVSIGSLGASTALVYIQDNVGWGWGLGIPCATMMAATAIFVGGTPFYVRRPPGGSPVTRMAQVVVASVRKWRAPYDSSKSLLMELPSEEHLRHGRRRLLRTQEFRFLDRAALIDVKDYAGTELSPLLDLDPSSNDPNIVIVQSYNSINPWHLCSVTQVEEVKLVLRIIPIILATLVFGLAHAQATTFFTRQGSTLDRTIVGDVAIAPASMQLFSSLSCLVAVPLYDRVLVPLAGRVSGNERGITLLQRIGVGMGLTALCMGVAAATEAARLHVARVNGLVDDPSAALPMSILWLVPQYILIGVSNVFTVVGKQEFFYDQVPDSMRSLGMAVYLLTSGAGAYLSSALISAVDAITSRLGGTSWFVDNLNRCHLDYFYTLLALLSLANLGVFIVVARNYIYKRAVDQSVKI